MINVNFLLEYNEPLQMTFSTSITVEEMILEFLKKTNSRLIFSKPLISFLYLNIFLNDPYFLTKALSKVFKKKINYIRIVDSQKQIIGKGNENFFLSRNKKDPAIFEIAKTGPEFKMLDHGLNIFGKCSNMSCRAYNKDVNVRIGIADFDFTKNQWELKCPCAKCHCLIKPEIFGFVGCKYSIKGVRYNEVNDSIEKIETEWKTVEKDEIQCYNPTENGSLSFIKLIVYTKKL